MNRDSEQHRSPPGRGDPQDPRVPARRDGLWHEPPSRAPPNASCPSQPVPQVLDPDSGITCQADPEFLEHARREELDQPQLPWEACSKPVVLVNLALDAAESGYNAPRA